MYAGKIVVAHVIELARGIPSRSRTLAGSQGQGVALFGAPRM
jgi:hypothetical protein